MIKVSWRGYYLDGKTADKQAVQIQVQNDGLKIVILRTGAVLLWPYAEIRQTQGFYGNEPVQLERGRDIPEILLIADHDFLTSLYRFAPQSAGRFHNPEFRSLRMRLTVYAAIGIVAVVIFMYLWGLPLLADVITPHVPMDWERGLGESALGFMAPEKKRCNDQNLQQAVDEIVARLNEAEPTPYTFKVYIVKSHTFNAVALPGGNIILFSGLIERTKSPEELASVLAHEMQHIKKRHVVRKVIEDSSTGLILSALSGDVTGSVLYGASVARTLASLSYSRQYEEEADESAMKMLIAANINPEQMIAMYEIMAKETGNMQMPEYISTHPELDDRLSSLKAINESSKSVTHDYKGLSSDSNWEEMKKGCFAPVRPHLK